MLNTLRRTALVALGIAAVVVPSSALASLASPQTLCSIAKLKAASSAFGCSLKQQTRIVAGGHGDTASCTEKLTDRFESAEGRGGCATSGDAALASSRANAAATEVMNVLGAPITATDEQLKCLKKKTRLASRYALCQAAALVNRLNHNYIGERDDFGDCRDALEEKSAALDLLGTCPATGEAEEVEEQSGAGYGFLPAAVWDTGDLRHAPLPHAYLVGSDLSRTTMESGDFRGADFTNAILENASMGSGEFYVPTDFRDANFTGASLVGVYLDRALLAGAQFGTASFERVHALELPACPASLPAEWACISGHIVGPTANMNDYDLEGADLSGTNMSYATMDSASFRNAILHDVDLSHATIYRTGFAGADMQGADLGSASLRALFGTGLVECPASLPSIWYCVKRNLLGFEAGLYGCDLVGADLSGIDAQDMYFSNCDLSDANLSGANLDSAAFYMTTCPDHVVGDCCDHYVGGAPLMCGYNP